MRAHTDNLVTRSEGTAALQGGYQEEVNAPAIAAAALGQVVPVGVGLNVRVALPEHIPEAPLHQQALEGLPLLRREAR